MPDDIYEIIALAARYWFLLLMVLIAWRSYRWYARDRKTYKKRLRLLPDAGYVGELVVTRGDESVKKGDCFLVPREGTLGSLRSNDVYLPVEGVANRHLWLSFDDADGLLVEPMRGRAVIADGEELTGRRMRAWLSHGSSLQLGEVKLRLRLFSGFEYAGEATAGRESLPGTEEDELSDALDDTPYGDSVRRMHQIAAWQTMTEDDIDTEPEEAFYPPEMDAEPYDDEELYDGAEMDDDDEFLPPIEDAQANTYELQDGAPVYYPPVDDSPDDEPSPGEDAPRALYVDDTETASHALWDKAFRGGKKP